MTQTATAEQYLESFSGATCSRFLRLRETAATRLRAMGFPTQKNEMWKYTDPSLLLKMIYEPQTTAARFMDSDRGLLNTHAITFRAPLKMVFLNGFFVPELSDTGSLFLRTVQAAEPKAVEKTAGALTSIQSPEHAFAALNAVFMTDGAFIEIPDGLELSEPIYLIFLATADSQSAHPRNLVRMGAGSRAKLIEHFIGAPDIDYMTNSLTEVQLGQESSLSHYKIQSEGRQSLHIGNLYVRQAAKSQFRSEVVSLGARLARNEIYCTLAGSESDVTLHGLYCPRENQHFDHTTFIDHQAPGCRSREHYKGVVYDRSRAVFYGKARVQPKAQNTDAGQLNNNLLLSDEGRVDTRPQLEIFADEVSCTHGATIGCLDEDALFYLRARGIGTDAANAILTDAFTTEIVDHFEFPELVQFIKEKIGAQGGLYGY